MTSQWWEESQALPPAPQQRGQGRRWVYPTLITLLVIALLVVSALFVYSARSAEDWQAVAEQRAADVAQVTGERDVLQDDLAAVQDDLAETTDKYSKANKRIRELADEKAQVGDRAAWLSEVTTLSKLVTAELDSCVSDLQDLQIYLVDYQSYDLEQLTAYAREVNDGCNQARSDSAALATLLDEQ